MSIPQRFARVPPGKGAIEGKDRPMSPKPDRNGLLINNPNFRNLYLLPGQMDRNRKPSSAVLVVEDEPFVRLMGVDLLEEAGFDVLQASNADEALRVLEAHPEVRVVFSDIEMPGGSTDRTSRGVFASAGPKSGSF